MNAIEVLELDPIEVEPNPCEHCGLTIDRHRRDDTDEGPEFFCLPADELDLDELELRAELIRQVEVAAIVRDMELNDPRDRWRHTGEPRPQAEETPIAPRQPYRTPQSTIDAFWYVAGLDDADRLTAWLEQHPLDVPFLKTIWGAHARSQ
jgi:hypothetical protein